MGKLKLHDTSAARFFMLKDTGMQQISDPYITPDSNTVNTAIAKFGLSLKRVVVHT